jgi:peptidylprolyl isomerase
MTIKGTWLPVWVSLFLALFLIACGPAAPREEVETDADTTAIPVETEEDSTATEPEASEPATSEDVEPAATIEKPEGEVTQTESGLEFIETRAGTGRTPEEGDIVVMHIIGRLEDGTVFADTYAQGQPVTATLTDVDLFPGWKEGVTMMQEGGKSYLTIPSDLAFGEQGAGGVIPPGATIIMEVELISAMVPPTPEEVAEADLTTTDSGLQYYDIEVGEGDMPVKGQTVVIQYTAWLEDGNEYLASSTVMDEPFQFALGADPSVFPGWDEGVSTMQVGGRRQLIIPPELALGEQGGGKIPPNATLIMEIELLELEELVLPTEVDEDDFTTTDSGLQYFDLEVGDGAEAATGQTVTVNYTGWLTDGVKFDSSLDGGQPFTFTLGQGDVISGWDEGVVGMRVGGKRQLVIPADLGYGAAGSGGVIPPAATLIFEVELLSVEDAIE